LKNVTKDLSAKDYLRSEFYAGNGGWLDGAGLDFERGIHVSVRGLWNSQLE